MSVLFYRRPDYLNKEIGPINADACSRYVERAKKSERSIPNGLTFEDVINGKSLPPCSLNDFMDYLVYVEHNAENLQFFLWYQDYKRRFNELSESEQKLSPEWIPGDKELPNLSKDKDPEKDPKKLSKRNTLGALMEKGYDANSSAFFIDDKDVTNARHTSMIKDNGSTVAQSIISDATTLTNAEVVQQAGLKWQPFTIQPMRDEINRVMRHYLAFTAPRELNLSHKDRASCLHALQHTTHPSALLPAIKIAEAALRGQSHPNFIRWSICNGNKPKIFFVRTMGVSHIIFGFIIALLLDLSRASRWWRIFAAPVWFIGFSTMVAAYKGLCVILHKSHVHNLRPWEQDYDSEMGESRRESFSSTADRGVQMASRTGNYDDNSISGASADDKETTPERRGSFRPRSLQTFGPKNTFEDAQWISKYKEKPIMQKVFEKSVWTQDETLRLLQDKIVLGANLWALILTTVCTVWFVALPKGNFY